jgi:hypothetical protein
MRRLEARAWGLPIADASAGLRPVAEIPPIILVTRTEGTTDYADYTRPLEDDKLKGLSHLAKWGTLFACQVAFKKGCCMCRMLPMIKIRFAVPLLVVAALAFAQPKQNVSAGKHPNLAAAQRLTAQAFAKIEAAQQANEFDLGGHAQKAKGLLDQANNELKQAAQTANKNK